jgi:membrane protease YdiL (CAAX protease family)
MLNLFWNSHEKRLRFIWRFLLQTLLWVFPFSVLASLTALAWNALGLPAGSFLSASLEFWTAASMVFSVWISGKYLDRRYFREYGFHYNTAWRRDFIFGLALGALLMAVVFVIELGAGWIHITGFLQNIQPGDTFVTGMLGFVFLYLCVGINEELWIRGYLLHNLAEALRFKFLSNRVALLLAYLISSILFGFLHAFNPNATLLSSIAIGAAGLFLGLGFLLTGELAIPIGIHITWNLFEGNVFGFPVSGLSSTTTFIQINQTGPVAWTGGAFGPEAGLAGLAVILLGCGLTLAWMRFSGRKIQLQDWLAQYLPPSAGGGDPPETAAPENYP